MQKILDFIEKYLLPPISKLAELKHLRAIRDGIVAVLPLIIVGSFFLLLGQLPLEFLAKYPIFNKFLWWYKNHTAQILMPYRLTFKLMALFASFTIAYYLAKSYKLDGIPSGVLSMSCFLIMQTPKTFEVLNQAGKSKIDWFLPMGYLGGVGLFAAIIGAFFTVEIVRFCRSKKMHFKMPEGVPPSVGEAFAALVPAVFIFIIVWGLVHIAGLDIPGLILKVFSPLIILGDTIWAVIFINFLVQLIWLGGIHGASVINAVFITIWLGYLDQNAAAAASNIPLPHITTLPFYQWFVWVGGSGATLSLVFLMVFSKSDYIKKLGKVSLLPGICNINEPIIYGLPMVMNPIMAIPFIITPIICGCISYFAMWANLVNRPSLIVPWTLPAPIGGFLATAYDWRAIVLIAVNFVIALLIYYPFFKEYEKTTLKEGKNESR